MPSFDWEISNRYRRRLAKQAGYQKAYREKLKAKRLPERDDVAKALLANILGIMSQNPMDTTDKLVGQVADLLVKAGFDRDGSVECMRAMAARHRSASLRRRA